MIRLIKQRYFKIPHSGNFSLICTGFETKCLNQLELIQTIKLLR